MGEANGRYHGLWGGTNCIQESTYCDVAAVSPGNASALISRTWSAEGYVKQLENALKLVRTLSEPRTCSDPGSGYVLALKSFELVLYQNLLKAYQNLLYQVQDQLKAFQGEQMPIALSTAAAAGGVDSSDAYTTLLR